MVRRRLLGGAPFVLLIYLAVDTIVIVLNPAKFVTQLSDYVGEPVGDLSEQVRLELADMAGRGEINSNVAWETDTEICGLTWSWNTPDGALGYFFSQADNLCELVSSVDYYSVEGVNTIRPAGLNGACGAVDMGSWRSYKFCDGNYLTRHIFPIPTVNITGDLGLPAGSPLSDIEVLFSSHGEAGIYENGNRNFVCKELTDGVLADCEMSFDFWGDDALEVRNATVGVRSAIFEELVHLASSEALPESLATKGMEEGICQAIGASEEVIDCSISCTASYPYPSSICVGTYELKLVKEISHRGAIIVAMAVVAGVCWLSLSTLRLGMRTPDGRSRRGYLGHGGSCQHFFEEEGDRISFGNPVPSMQVVTVSPGNISESRFSSLGLGLGLVKEKPVGLGIVVSGGIEELPREAITGTRAPVALDNPRRRATSSESARHIATLPVCFMVREAPGGSLKNLDVEEAYRLLDKHAGRALLDESFGGDHLAWARGFSVVDATGCLLTLWTVHFVAANSGWGSFYWVAALIALSRWLEESDVIHFIGSLRSRVRVTPKNRSSSSPPLPITLAVMEVLYDLSVPGVEVIGLVATAVWSVMIAMSCGYFIFLLGYEPVYEGGGVYSRKVSLATALAVGRALNAPFALAGDWVRGSRCGDLEGRLAVSFCLGNPQTADVARVSHVSVHSELYPTSIEESALCGDGCCN